MFEVAEHATAVQQAPDFLVQLSLPFVHQVMNREARYHCVERAERRERLVEIVGDDVDSRRSGEPLSGQVQHVRREVERDTGGLRPLAEDEVQ